MRRVIKVAKTIKFNLICDGKPVRTIEDLQNNFSVEDILAYYNNKLLHRWLSVRGYNSELKDVSAITSEDPMEIIKELIYIFGVVTDEKEVEKSIYIFKYLNERKELSVIYESKNYEVKNIIRDYEIRYCQLVEGIIENFNDMAVIKANIAEIVENYPWILKLDHRKLFYTFREKSALAVMCLLMNEKTRNYYLPVEIVAENGTVSYDTEKNIDKMTMFVYICQLIKQRDFAALLEGNLMTFSGITDGYWKDLEPKGKQYMIISMENGDFVRAAGYSGGALSSADILNKFVIVDGIDYKSNSSTHKLLYMEV